MTMDLCMCMWYLNPLVLFPKESSPPVRINPRVWFKVLTVDSIPADALSFWASPEHLAPSTAFTTTKHVLYNFKKYRQTDSHSLCHNSGNPAQRPTAEECLCYPWLQPGAAAFLNHKVPLSVLDRLVKYDSRIWGSKDWVPGSARQCQTVPCIGKILCHVRRSW